MLNPAPLLLVVFLACSESPAPQAPTSATPKAEGVAPAPVKDSGAIVGITLKVQDYQVFHPFSRTRALLQATSPTPTPRAHTPKCGPPPQRPRLRSHTGVDRVAGEAND